tara:strand:- start:420 stop:788 length:369 start_codon:yes stop_codon:yes gene_type:complete
MNHPIQPIVKDADGVNRFKRNHIIDYLFDECLIDLNKLQKMDFPAEDRQQLAQLLGYSISGYGDLDYVDNYAYGVAAMMVNETISDDKARIAYLEKELRKIRNALKPLCADLFRVDIDDLKE